MSSFSLFSVIGIEIEYMLVDKLTLNIQPKSDVILSQLAGHLSNEVVLDKIAVSNELVMHVLELKNNGPKPLSAPIADQFQKTLLRVQSCLDEHNLMLLPTGAHPWMRPHRETVRWPHGNKAIYQQYDTIFDCRGHGWANLQSMHVNLPYANTDEFNQLHNVIRLILPLLPALAASTPILDGKATGQLDSRLAFYNANQQRIPSISGAIIPEFIQSEHDYQQKILNPMYEDIKPFDPQGLLQHPWLNSRAAIVKPEQKAIEIRIIDSQECVDADIAIAKTISAILKQWQSTSNYYLDNPCDTRLLRKLYDQTGEKGLSVVVENKELLKQWQLPTSSMTVRDIWSLLLDKVSSQLNQKEQLALELILKQGNLSERILLAAGAKFNHPHLMAIYQQLAHCLSFNQQFLP